MTRRPGIADLAAIAVPEQPALSPDAREVTYVLRTLNAEADRAERSLWRVDAQDGPAAVRLTRGRDDSAPAYSPDGTRLAFLRAQDGPAQVWVLPVRGGEPEQVTTLPLGAGSPVWSPNGDRIAFTAPVDLDAPPGEQDAAREKRAVTPLVTERLDYQADGVGFLRTVRQHVHLVEMASGHCRRLTDGDWHASDPAFSPDGRQLTFSAGMAADHDLTFRSACYVIDVDDPAAVPQPLGPTDAMMGPVTWAAGGQDLLAVGTLWGPAGHAHLLRVALDGGGVTDLTAGLDRNVMPGGPGYPGGLPRQSADGTVLFCARDRGCTHLYAVGVDGGAVRTVLGGAGRVVSGLAVAADRAAVVLGTESSFGEIAVVDVRTGAVTVRTDHGSGLAGTVPHPRREREFTISDGTVVHGWLMRADDQEGPGPLLVDVHGGPHNAWNGAADEVHLYHQDLLARGWTVLLLNPRGSDGYGEAFYTAGVGAWGSADAKDFLEPIDALVAEGIADPARLAVAGYSYGGYMASFLTSRDTRFAAAVAGGVVADLTSMAGTSDAGHLLADVEIGGLPWVERGRYQASSPLAMVGEVATPTLIIQGDADRRCPVGQAQQWHTALREIGVPTRLVLYPGASHLFILNGRPSHRRDWGERIVAWLERYAGSGHPTIDAAHWQRRLAALAERHKVPGAVLGILRLDGGGDDDIACVAYGVLNKRTAAPVAADSVFQVGSISKVWTATMVMQLVDEGRLDLDTPIAAVLPDLRLSDPQATEQVTMRHLLTHTSGIDGDVFTDTGRGDDCVERYVAGLAEAAQNHPLGATWSYCNSGFIIAGRVVEKLTGLTWDQAVAERLFRPLGLERAMTLPEQALLHSAAVGHVSEGGADPQPAPVWGLPRAMGPAGLITASAGDVLAFARMHLAGGRTPDGTTVLSEAAAAQMTEHQVDLPDAHTLGDSWGLGWIRFGWGGHRLVGHDGNTIGQSAFLRLLPEKGLAVTLLTNGGNAKDLSEDLLREVFADLADVPMPRPIGPLGDGAVVDFARHLGRYERASESLEVLDRDGTPTLRITATGPLAELVSEKTQELVMEPADGTGDLFVVRAPGTQTWTPVTFYALPTGERYVHFGVRATPKIG